MPIPRLTDQLRRHSVALISLVVAISSLGYNTWRNELTEANRNVRSAGFELINKLADLDLVVFNAYFARCSASARAAPPAGSQPPASTANFHPLEREGWAYVLAVRDLGRILPTPVQDRTEELFTAWSAKSAAMISCDAHAHRVIDESIEAAREATLEAVRALD